ncbi:TPA: HEPN/Toprim-associated domain-containing protein [Pseudomonas aeruginosa]|uniref:HEPN/Toprim-associated domain-containing protein n=1 Tax=Pseudomonas aeruginosa TaxID=287 RepID=UPI003838C8A3
MGSFAQITIGGYPISSTKNYYHQWYFRKKDRVIRVRDKSQRNTLIWCAAEPHEQHEEETDYLYVVSGSVLRRRLELAGFNRETLEREFKECTAQRIASLEESFQFDEDWAREQSKRAAILKSSSLADWLKCFKTALDEGITSWQWDERKQNYTDPLLHILFTSDVFWDEALLHDTGFPCQTLESMAVAMLEIVPAEAECVLDITDLIGGGWTNAFEDIIEYNKDFTTFYDVFATSIVDTQSLMALSPENITLARLLYANVITAMETYLSDTMKKQALTREAIRRRFVQTNETFKEKIVVQEIFRKLEGLNEEITQTIDTMSFHNLDKVAGLYKAVLDTKFPSAHMAALKSAVEKRHDIVHRNGKTVQGKTVNVAMEDVEQLIELVDSTIKHIDKQIKDGLLDDEED